MYSLATSQLREAEQPAEGEDRGTGETGHAGDKSC